WGNGPTPSADSETNSLELGVKFRSDQNGFITGLRFYKDSANTGTHVGHLWSSDGTMLAEATFTGESGSGWQEVSLDNPPLHALAVGQDGPNGAYTQGPSGTFPAQTFQSTNYWDDVSSDKQVGP